MLTLLLIGIAIGFASAVLSEGYHILLNKRALMWFKAWVYKNVKNDALKEVLVICDVCLAGQIALWTSLTCSIYIGLKFSIAIVVLFSIAFAVITATLLGRKIFS